MEWPILLAAGLAAGLVSGLFGVGGGIVLTPVLHYILGYAWADAVALSLLVITVQAPLGIYQHARRDAVRPRLALPLATGGLGGVLLGAWLLPRIQVPWLKLAFAALMVFAAWRMVGRIQARRDEGRGLNAPLLLALGFAAGVVSRLLGVGGGILTVPVLALLGVPAHLAVGTSLVSVWTNATFATVLNLIAGIDWTDGVLLAAGALAGVPAGVWAAHALPETGLRRVIAGGLTVAAVYVAVTSGAF